MAALLLLSLLWAFGPLRSDLLPNLLPHPSSEVLPHFALQAFPFALLAFLSGGYSLLRTTAPPSRHSVWIAVRVGIGLFFIPAILVHLSESWLSPSARTALFTLVPIFTVVFEPYIGIPTDHSLQLQTPQIIAGLAALLGTLFVFPVEIPSSVPAALAIAAIVLGAAFIAAANCQAVALFQNHPGDAQPGMALITSIAAGTTAICFLGTSAFMEAPFHLQAKRLGPALGSACLELPALILLFRLFSRMSATRMATRYLLAPVLVILIGIAIVHPEDGMQLRTWLGLALITTSTLFLLLRPASIPHPARFIP
jgi:drug/metabolite transporter (DMT)-like permease